MWTVRGFFIGHLIIAILTFWPGVLVLIASAVVRWNACAFDEAAAHTCVVKGRDLGELLYSMNAMGWLLIGTVPAGVVAAGGWTVTWVIWRMAQRRRARSAGTK